MIGPTHILRHPCSDCDRSFTTKKGLQNHALSIHGVASRPSSSCVVRSPIIRPSTSPTVPSPCVPPIQTISEDIDVSSPPVAVTEAPSADILVPTETDAPPVPAGDIEPVEENQPAGLIPKLRELLRDDAENRWQRFILLLDEILVKIR